MFTELKPREVATEPSIPWLPPLPKDWDTRRGKSLFRREQRNPHLEDGVVTCFRDGMVTLRSKRRTTGFTEAVQEIGYQGIRRGDLVIHAMDAFAGAVGVSDSDGKSSPVYAACTPIHNANPHYYATIVREMARTSWIAALSRGVRERSTDFRFEAFANQTLPVPAADEQAAIVKYLGHAHARIDRAIAAKRKLIALLEEQKRAIIHQAVTRGLDPTVPLKDSGIPWLGEIPEHWGVTRAKYLFSEFDRRSGTGAERLLSLRAAAGLVYHDEVSAIPIGPATLEKYKLVSPGNLVMNRMRAASGLFAIAAAPGLVSPDYSTMTVDSSVDANFYLRLFKTQAAMVEFKKRSSGLGTGEAGFMRLYSDDFGRVPLPLPPLEEQRAIVSTLDVELGRSAAVATKASHEIELLREFRTRLTSDVVTGQVDVREIAATLPDLTDNVLAMDSNQAEDLVEDVAEDFLEGEP